MRFMTMNEVAESLSVSRMTVHRLINSGQLQVLKVNRAVRIPEASFQEFVKRNLKNFVDVADSSGKETQKTKLTEVEFSLEGMFKEGDPIPEEAINEVIKEWDVNNPD